MDGRIYVYGVLKVADQTARFALAGLSIGETVHQTDDRQLYVVKDNANLDNANGYTAIGIYNSNERILILGDSISQALTPGSWVQYLTCTNQIVNNATGGQTAAGLWANYNALAKPYAPNDTGHAMLAIVFAERNDITNDDQTGTDTYNNSVAPMMAALKSDGFRTVFITPIGSTQFTDNADWEGYRQDAIALNLTDPHTDLVIRGDLLISNEEMANPVFSADGVHQTTAKKQWLAAQIQDALQLSYTSLFVYAA